MYITEESKDALRRKVKEYEPSLAEKFPPVKLMCVGNPWAFKLEPMTSHLKNLNGDAFEWKVPKNFIEEATDEALKQGLLKKIRTYTYSTKLPNIQLCFYNGRYEMRSPEFGNLYKYNTELQVEDKINTIGIRYAENTLELVLNDTFGVNSYLSSANTLPDLTRVIYLKPQQQIVGVHGKIWVGTNSKSELMWFSFIVAEEDARFK